MRKDRITSFWKRSVAALNAGVGLLLTVFLFSRSGIVSWFRVVLALFLLVIYVVPGVILWREHQSIQRSRFRIIRLIPFLMFAGLLVWASVILLPPLLFHLFYNILHVIVSSGPLTVIAMTFNLAVFAIGIQVLCAIVVFGYWISKRTRCTQQRDPCVVATRAEHDL